MSDIIHLLPDTIANQIAAGEVVQRPASIVKELIENAIDAKADYIKVYIVDAGKSLIQIVDNGIGMSETDARLSFERHSTSKISHVEDLYALRTMGFRGEALASISAVAQVELRTRTKENDLGTLIQIEGGTIKNIEYVSCPVGANFLVKNIFFNVPVRRKFLKSNQTELTNIITEFQRVALSNFNINFELYNDDNLIEKHLISSVRKRIISMFGKKIDKQLIPVSANTNLIKISGFVGIPESAKKKCIYQYFYVNGRYMRHPYFYKAIHSAYERLIQDGLQIPFFIFFELNPSYIDVNIHPTKTEIKFQDEQTIWQILLSSVREALAKNNAVPTIDFDTVNRPEIPAYTKKQLSNIEAPKIILDNSFNPFEYGNVSDKRKWKESYSSMVEKIYANDVKDTEKKNNNDLFAEIHSYKSDTESISNLLNIELLSETNYFIVLNKYLVIAILSGIMIIDINKAYARVLYDQYKSQISIKKGISHKLLFPEKFSLSSVKKAIYQNIREYISFLGFEVEIVNNDFFLKGVPAGIESLDGIGLLETILQDIEDNGAERDDTIAHHIAFSISQKLSEPFTALFTNKDIKKLLSKLFSSIYPQYTPSGEKILRIINSEELITFFN